MTRFTYKGRKTNEISFPLGGIGAGCIGLAGNGRLIDWEIFNRPNKGSFNGLSHFAVKAEKNGKVLDARILQGDLHPPYSGEFGDKMFGGFGYGSKRENLCGMPHFREHEFRGEYPLAKLFLGGENFPGKVTLHAWSPFIPTNDYDSGLPGAFFEIELENNTGESIDYTIVGALSNPFGQKGAVNRLKADGEIHQLYLTNSIAAKDAPEYGDLCLSTDAEDISYQEYWYRGQWCDSLETYWQELVTPGKFKNRSYDDGQQGCWERCDTGHLAAHVSLASGETRRTCFVITWNIPNCRNYWRDDADERAKEAGIPNAWKNWYATQWKDSADSGNYAVGSRQRLYDDTKLFHDLLFRSSLPETAVEAVSATLSVLKSPACLRLEDGTFYGWEGTGCTGGCCEGSCTHVWNYQQAMAFLFPMLERSMRTANYKNSVDEYGGSHFRIQLPLGIKARMSDFRPCADGQFGDVIKAYRDWKISGNNDWLKELWPTIKSTIEYAWHENNYDKWDPEKTGVLRGRQHHTLDMELFGPNAWLTGFYLAALKAGAEMADFIGDQNFAAECRNIFAKGKAWADKNLFNGEYYSQLIDLKDKSILERFEDNGTCACSHGNAVEQYWSEEHGEIKYQVGDGCGIDMVAAQWHANLCGLGEIFDAEKTKNTLIATFKHNFKTSMRDEYNPWRIFCVNDEAGLVICGFPDGKKKPKIPIPYTQETMHGFEYAAAIHMIQVGLMDDGMRVVESIRNRYDGEKRNPWNEIECGSNYARSMAAYALLNTFSGFKFDMTGGLIGFDPVQINNNQFRCFWSLDSGWGEFSMEGHKAEVAVSYGLLELKHIVLPAAITDKITEVILGGREIDFKIEDNTIILESPIKLNKGEKILFE